MRTALLCAFLLLRAGFPTAHAATPDPHLGTEADGGKDNPTDPTGQTFRVNTINPAWVRMMLHWDLVQPTPTTWNWTDCDRIIGLNYGKGRKILATVFPYPDWLASKEPADWMVSRNQFVTAVVKRYGNKIAALESCNEPGLLRPDQAWGYIAGVTNDTTSLNSTLLKLFAADKKAVAGTRIKIAGPAFSSENWHVVVAQLFAAGAGNYVDICTYHDYSGQHLHPNQRRPEKYLSLDALGIAKAFKKACGGKMLFCDELGLYGQSASSAKHPNTGPSEFNSGFTEREGILDAQRWAVALRAGGVDVIFPHVIIQGCSYAGAASNNLELYGWEFDDSNGRSDPGMKSKTKSFLNSLRNSARP